MKLASIRLSQSDSFFVRMTSSTILFQLSLFGLVTFFIQVIVITPSLIIRTTRSGRGMSLLGIAQAPNQSMKPTAPWRDNFSMFATTPCRGLSLSR
jgi:hypothetical protein